MIKFDHIAMNPPYSGSLHLKIVEEAVKHSDDVVNLSPIRWLQDPLAEIKKGADIKKYKNIVQQISSIEVIPLKDANDLFGAKFGMDLGIYHITPNGGWKGFPPVPSNDVILKIEKAIKDTWAAHAKTSAKDFFVRTSLVYNPSGGNPNCNLLGEDKERQLTMKDEGTVVRFFNFETKSEAENFYNAAFLKLNRFIKKIGFSSMTSTGNFSLLPYLGDYTHKWTDADLYTYFGLTEDEIKIIEEEMKEK